MTRWVAQGWWGRVGRLVRWLLLVLVVVVGERGQEAPCCPDEASCAEPCDDEGGGGHACSCCAAPAALPVAASGVSLERGSARVVERRAWASAANGPTRATSPPVRPPIG